MKLAQGPGYVSAILRSLSEDAARSIDGESLGANIGRRQVGFMVDGIMKPEESSP